MQRQEGSKLESRQFNIIVASNTHFPSHIHYVYEVFCVRKGTATAVIDGNTYFLSAGEGLAVFPLQYHSYTVDNRSQIEIFVFTPHFIGEFEDLVSGKKPEFAKFDTKDIPNAPKDTGNILCMKAFFYNLCYKMVSRIQLIEGTVNSSNLSALDNLFLFVDRNYAGSCSLSEAARVLKYDYTYLSKLFKEKTGMGYNEYVNRFRVGKATYQLISSDASVAQIALEVGYTSIRTFNWEFQKIFHTTPAAYRASLTR